MKRTLKLAMLVAVLLVIRPWAGLCFEREDYEEEAGASLGAVFNPDSGIYGMSVNDGTWLKGTPVYGDFFLTLFQNDLEDAFYSGLGMTIRLMPHWQVAPFVGGGGSYNYSWSSSANAVEISDGSVQADTEARGSDNSYFGGHAESGLRLKFDSGTRMLEFMGRYTWSSSDGEMDYWLAGISFGGSW